MFCALAGCTSPVARHRLHVTSADPLPRWPSPLAGCSSADPLAVTAGRLHVTGCTSRQRTRCPAGRHRWPVARHRLHVTSADPVAPLAVTRWPVARQRTRWPSPLAGCSSRLNVTGCPAGRLLVTSADPLKMALFAYSGEFPEFYLLSLNSNVYFNCSGETTSN
jgi:hypothetical protein